MNALLQAESLHAEIRGAGVQVTEEEQENFLQSIVVRSQRNQLTSMWIICKEKEKTGGKGGSIKVLCLL